MTAEPCTREPQGGTVVGAACPDCGHTTLVHPGAHNPALTACVICTLLAR